MTLQDALGARTTEAAPELVERIDKGKFKLSVTPGETKTGAVTLAARTYTIYCDIAGHRSSRMEAKLVVN